MLKYRGDNLQKEILTLFRNIIIEQKVPNEWKSSITIPIFKKGQKTMPDNYRGITLLNRISRLSFTRTLLDELNKTIQIREEQQGFTKKKVYH